MSGSNIALDRRKAGPAPVRAAPGAVRVPVATPHAQLRDPFGPTTVMLSDRSPDRLRVSWSPVQPEQVQQYRVEYGEIPSGPVRILAPPSYESSALLTQLHADTECLTITVALLRPSDLY